MKYSNNPLNIRSGSKWHGLCGNKNGFCEFSSITYGIRAGLYLLLKSYPKHGVTTIKDCIYRWAPPTENKTSFYLKYVCQHSRLKHDDIITSLNIKKLFALVRSMCYIESNFVLSFTEFYKAYCII